MNQELLYKDRFVAFLDILGFSNMVYSDSKINKAKIYFYQTQIKSIVKQLKDDIEDINKVHAKENKDMRIEFNHVIISDSIVLTVDIIKTKNRTTMKAADDIKSIFKQQSTLSNSSAKKLGEMIGNFGDLHNLYSKLNRLAFALLCEKIALLQVYLASKDIWLRGAITSGETFIDVEENQIIGKAYIDAYKLESNYAIYPRVIIDTKLIKELEFKNEKEFLDFYNQNYVLVYNWENHSIKKDLPLFISFITYIDNLEKESEAKNLFESIVNNIENNIYGDISLYKKYFWLVEYTKDCLSNQNNKKYDYLLTQLKGLG